MDTALGRDAPNLGFARADAENLPFESGMKVQKNWMVRGMTPGRTNQA